MSDDKPKLTKPQIDPKQIHITHQWKYSRPLMTCRFDPQGRFVFSTSEDYAIQRWELTSGNRVDFKAHESWVRTLGFSPDGKTLYSGGYDGQLIFWNSEDDEPKALRTLEAHQGWIRCLAVSPDGTQIATGGNDNRVRVWKTNDGSLLRELHGHESHVYSILFHPDGTTLLSGDLSGKIHQWNPDSDQPIRTFDASALHTYNGGQRAHYGGIRSMSLSPDHKFLVCSGLHKATNPFGAISEPLAVVFDWESQKTIRSHTLTDVKGILWQAIYHDQLGLIGGSGGQGGGWIAFWNSDQDAEHFKFKLPNILRDLDLHPDGLQIATVHHDHHVRISSLAAKATS